MPDSPQRPFSLRLSPDLVARVDQCADRLRASGLAVTRTDVARMLIVRAIDIIGSDPRSLLLSEPPRETEGG